MERIVIVRREASDGARIWGAPLLSAFALWIAMRLKFARASSIGDLAPARLPLALFMGAYGLRLFGAVDSPRHTLNDSPLRLHDSRFAAEMRRWSEAPMSRNAARAQR